MKSAPTENSPVSSRKSVVVILGPLLIVIFAVLFHPIFAGGVAHFANDGPYGTLLARPYQVPDSFRGIWNDLLWLGAWNGNFNPNLTGAGIAVLGPSLYHKAMIPLGLIFLGLCVSLCLHTFKLPRWVCVLGGLAAALNMNVFSNACWGLPSRAHAMGAAFLAIAAFHACNGRLAVIKAMLAGLALGLGISEGGDNGAIFAMVAGVYGFFRAFAEPGPTIHRTTRGVSRVIIAAVLAGLFAAQTLNIFVNLAVKGVVGMSDDRLTPEQKWDFATQGSLHPKETLRVIIPGLYGYRMDAEDGGNYWGRVGESISAQGKSRHSGAGEHAGVIVVLIALWAIHQALRRQGGTFTDDERRCIWFWSATALICLLLAWGKWGPLYHVLYSLPYFNTIRLPLKWMHPFHLCLLILFAYGLAGLGRRYFRPNAQPQSDRARSRSAIPQKAGWWSALAPVERQWIWFLIGAGGIALVGVLLHAAAEPSLARELSQAGVLGDPARMAAFSVREGYWFLLFLALASGVLLAMIAGRFRGSSVLWPAGVIAFVLSADLVRGNSHWMQFFNYEDRYALNPPLDYLKAQSANYRVAKVPDRPIVTALQAQAQASRNDPVAMQQLQHTVDLFQNIRGYTHEQWQQNQFPYYNIPCLDMSQEPRLPGDKLAFNTAMARAAANGHATREYELTSTRFFVGLAGQAGVLNAYLDRTRQRFREGPRFQLESTRPNSTAFGDLRVRADTNGPFALIEFDGALPRASLFQRWEVITNETDTLSRLAAPDFDPAETVLVHDAIAAPSPGASAATEAAGPSDAVIQPIQSSHRLDLQVKTSQPGVLLLTDRYDPAWHVTVDGREAPLLRCNYLMRGVQIPAGAHAVTFQYRPNTSGIWLMAGCDALAGLLLAFLGIKRKPAA